MYFSTAMQNLNAELIKGYYLANICLDKTSFGFVLKFLSVPN